MVITRTLGKKYSSFSITSTQTVLGTIMLLIVSFFNRHHIVITDFSLRTGVPLVCLSVLSTIVAFFCYNYALTKISAASASIFINGVPFITALIAWAVLGDDLTAVQITGGVIIIIAVTVTNIYGNVNTAVKTGKSINTSHLPQ